VEQKKLFINSLLLGIVPNALIFNIDHSETTVCIDGKQRITSIIEFMDNQFSVLINDEYLYYDHETRKSLEKVTKSIFDNRDLFVVSYVNLSYEQQLEIFTRIQYGSPLTLGELIPGRFSSKNNAIIFINFCDGSYNTIKKFVRNSKKRKAHYIVFAKLFYVINKNNMVYPERDALLKFISKIDEIGKIIEDFLRLHSNLSKIINHPKFPKLCLSTFIWFYKYMYKFSETNDIIISYKSIILFANTIKKHKKITENIKDIIKNKYNVIFRKKIN
jgi:hypothetical protein